jgi:6-phosphogluconolactonase
MNNSVTIETIEPRAFASVVAEELAAVISEAVEERGCCCIALAGGKTPGTVYRKLALPPVVQQIDWDKVKLFWGDERWVPHSDNQSNAHMVQETILNHITMPPANVFRVDTSLASPKDGALAYEKTITSQVESQGGIPQFDVVLLGIGSDGHTASLFPDRKAVWDKSATVVATTNSEGVERVSLSAEVLMNARKIYFLVTGEEKADIVNKALHTVGEELHFPAQIYRRHPEKVTWFLDSAAATILERSGS